MLKPYLVLQYEKLQKEKDTLEKEITNLRGIISARDETVRRLDSQLKSSYNKDTVATASFISKSHTAAQLEDEVKMLHQTMALERIKIQRLSNRLRSFGVRVDSSGNMLQ